MNGSGSPQNVALSGEKPFFTSSTVARRRRVKVVGLDNLVRFFNPHAAIDTAHRFEEAAVEAEGRAKWRGVPDLMPTS